MNISAPKSLVGCSHPSTLGACGKEASQPPNPASKYVGQLAQALSYRERDDSYFAVVASLTTTHRVIVDADGLQFILQKRHAEGAHGAVWRSMGYAASATGLASLCARSLPQFGANQRRTLAALPERPRDCPHLACASK